jgi:hypothetical protein
MAVVDYRKDLPQADNLYWRQLVTWTLLNAFTVVLGYAIAAVVRSFTADLRLLGDCSLCGVHRLREHPRLPLLRHLPPHMVTNQRVWCLSFDSKRPNCDRLDFYHRLLDTPPCFATECGGGGGAFTTVLMVISRYRSRVVKVMQRQFTSLNFPFRTASSTGRRPSNAP